MSLKYDQDLIKEFGITPEDDIDPELKLAYVRSQLDEVKKFLWRERVELQLAESQVKSGLSHVAAGASVKVEEHRNNIKGIILSVRRLTELKNDLEAKVS